MTIPHSSVRIGDELPTSASKYISSPHAFAASFSGPSWVTSILVVVATLLVLEQYVYRTKKRHLPGAAWTIPLIGKFADSLNPTMEAYKRTWATDLSVVSVFNIFIVMASSTELTRKILNSPTYAEPCLVASAKPILEHDNWVFSTGKVHVDYRKGLNTLFTKRALAMYLRVQEKIYKKYFAEWLADKDPKAKPYQMAMRDLNMETSLRVFCGNYIPAHGAAEVSDKYWLITKAMELVNFPFALPGTKVYNAIKARKVTMKWFELAASESKKRMAAGEEPNCLVDEWVKNMQNARATSDTDDQTKILSKEYSDHEIAQVLLSFLFASQDAMTSGVIYTFQHVADHPEVLRKLREEQFRVRGGDVNMPMTLELLEEMPYTRAIVRETLRLKPPVIMVPYLTKKPFQIREDYVVPSGSMLIPSFWNSLHDQEQYPDPDAFVPERWMPGGVSEKSDPKNYLVFGAGPHKCIGYDYALMHIAAVIATASVTMEWEHEVTPTSEDVNIIATIFPKDGCRLKFKPLSEANIPTI